jgi:uncharacterized protein YjbJ (UPF0337 family)
LSTLQAESLGQTNRHDRLLELPERVRPWVVRHCGSQRAINPYSTLVMVSLYLGYEAKERERNRMNRERFAGICRQAAGGMIEILGELRGKSLQAATGRRDRLLGKAQQARGLARDESARQLENFLQRNRNWQFLGKRHSAK